MIMDRLPLVQAWAAAGLQRDGAAPIATALGDPIGFSVATEAEVSGLEISTKSEIGRLELAHAIDGDAVDLSPGWQRRRGHRGAAGGASLHRARAVIGSDALLEAAEAAADVAGAVIRPFFRASLAIEDKYDASPVTLADRTAEMAMRAVLAGRFPQHGILGEEFGLERPDARLRWVLDPIDGTRAFITGRAQFGTLIGLLDDGVPVLGVIDQPVTGERWIGVTGRPTVFRGPLGGAAGVRPCPILARAELSCTSPEMFAPDQWAAWRRVAGAVARTSFGGDCYAYGLLALGHIDVIAEADLKVWDWAALAPVIEGAGGRMTDWQGAPLRGDPDGGSQAGPVLAVGDPALLAPVLALLGAAA